MKLKTTIVSSVVGVTLLVTGYALGYFYNDYKLISEMYSSIVIKQEVSDAKFNYALVKLLDEGRSSEVSGILKTRLYTNLLLFDDFTTKAQSDDMRKEVMEVISKISEHDKKYPYRFSDTNIDSRIEDILSKAEEIDGK